ERQGQGMNNEQRWMAEIRETNLSYLILAQRLIREDRAQALYRLGVSEGAADLHDPLAPGQRLPIPAGNQQRGRFGCDAEQTRATRGACTRASSWRATSPRRSRERGDDVDLDQRCSARPGRIAPQPARRQPPGGACHRDDRTGRPPADAAGRNRTALRATAAA